MSFFALTSGTLLAAVAVLTAACFLWAILWVPNHPWTKLWAYVQQALAVLLCSVLAISLAFLAVNRVSLWYSNWHDLLGFLSKKPATQQQFGAAPAGAPQRAEAAAPSKKTPKAHFTQAQRNPLANAQLTGINPNASGGQWVNVVVPGQGEQGDATVRVWLPPSYLKNPDKAYPVIMAFAGVPGSPVGFEQPLHTGEDLAKAVSEGKIRDSIIVAPNVFPRDRDTECMDVEGTSIETWVTQKVVPWVKANLAARRGPGAWATYGYSAGGWCANMFTIRHPELFRTTLSMSGYYSPTFREGEAPAGAEAYDLGAIASRTQPPVRIWNYSGTGDGKFRTSFDKFAPQVKAPTSLTSVEVAGSSHRWPVWEEAQMQGLEWLGKTVPAFSPASA